MVVRKFVRLPYLPIVTYHRLGIPARDAVDLDDSVVDATPTDFDKQVALMSSRFSLVGIDELLAHFSGEKQLPKNPAILTFDDGYKACFDHALPTLKKYNAKAIFFISTSHMSDRIAFWWDRVNYLVKRSTKTRFELSYPEAKVYDLTNGNRAKIIQHILDVIKESYALDVERYLQELATALDVEWTRENDRRITDDVLMTWDQVRALRKEGMDVESHTHTHRVLPTLTPEDLRKELQGSKKILEEQLDEPCRAVAYPVSLELSKHKAIADEVKLAGYELGFSTSRGIGALGPDADPLDIQRIWVDPNLPHNFFRAALAVPHLTYRRR